MNDQPTSTEVVQWLREEAEKSRLAVILAALPRFSGTPQQWADDAAWHDAAADQIEELAVLVRKLEAELESAARQLAAAIGVR